MVKRKNFKQAIGAVKLVSRMEAAGANFKDGLVGKGIMRT